MPRVVIRHRVKDFSSWKQAYLAHGSVRAAAGVTRSRVCQAVDDPNHVLIEFECKDLAKVKQLAQSQEVKDVMKNAGVLDTPDMYFLTDGETFSN